VTGDPAMAVVDFAWLKPVAVLGISAVTSLVAFVTYGVDKDAAQRGARRVPENTLHMLALLGGWPGAFAAQQMFRHKTRKVSFQIVFWFTVALNCAAVVLILSTAGERVLSNAFEISSPNKSESRRETTSELPVVTPAPRRTRTR
jgi:uncharacterized membrane protein YsdA (DUF1294 family)